ncbi:PilW family protein [Psychromonas sp.]|uniref:PilW family protein n=1 Tax=Psychromonas sp. TaxID=1884585 RepID=UPI003561C7C0
MQSKQLNLKNNKIGQGGFTLIELMVAMVISLTLIFACTVLYSSLKSSISTAQELAKAQESLRGAYYLLSRSVRHAGSVAVGTSGALITTYGASPASGDKIYSCLGNDDRVSGSTDTYWSEDNDLYCDDEIDKQKIALGVTGFTFTTISHANSTGDIIYDGVEVTMEIDGMPSSYAGGLTFTLALRQKVLLELAD